MLALSKRRRRSVDCAASFANSRTDFLGRAPVLTCNRVEGATFPNWVGSTRTREQLTLIVVGDRMTEYFQRPAGTRIQIEWHRVK
ncbi:MAG: hypothetical protein E5Y61_03140 [Mesorhizobium sp.]|nr:MAG: hypothetical protein E5Y61_03140 [Mesorhizobium sp.]TIM64709.1 MAG: hypothetical protein E5Y60_22710 [Mesorhizobium sp.]